ncbi:MAG: rod shape-determining protein [Planctomycetes bacterium]|nr:rod shape-determining protein [Planctomycetota bacterium]
MPFNLIAGLYSPDIAVDAGSGSTRIHVAGRGLVLSEPSVLALRRPEAGGDVIGAGEDVRELLWKAPGSVVAHRPVQNGTVADPQLAALLMAQFVERAVGRRRFFKPKPRAVVAVPAGLTQVEKAAYAHAFYGAGCRDVLLVERPRAAAIALALPRREPRGVLLLDIGRDMVEVAVVSMASIVVARALRGGSAEIDRAIIRHIRATYNLLVGEATAERVKKQFVSVNPPDGSTFEVRGRDLITNLPNTVVVTAAEITGTVLPVLERVASLVSEVLAEVSPEIAGDLIDVGVILFGEGALLDGLTGFLSARTGLPVMLAEDPATVLISGAGIMCEDIPTFAAALERG